jgi:hypothetical protein
MKVRLSSFLITLPDKGLPLGLMYLDRWDQRHRILTTFLQFCNNIHEAPDSLSGGFLSFRMSLLH